MGNDYGVKMQKIGHFTTYEPTIPELGDDASFEEIRKATKLKALVDAGAGFLQNESAEDWYDVAHSLPIGKYVAVSDGIVSCVDSDLTKMYPRNMTVYAVDADYSIGDAFSEAVSNG